MTIERTSLSALMASEKARYLVIVARDQPDLWRYLTQDFTDYNGVEVVLDRRVGERRHDARRHEPDRRWADRRRPLSVDNHLRRRGFVVIHRQD